MSGEACGCCGWPILSSACGRCANGECFNPVCLDRALDSCRADRMRLREVAEAARDVLKAYDNAERESDWTGALVDTVLRTTLAALNGEATDA